MGQSSIFLWHQWRQQRARLCDKAIRPTDGDQFFAFRHPFEVVRAIRLDDIRKLTFTLRGETIPPVCSKANYECKIDMKVTVPAKKPLDLSVVEYAKKPSSSKYSTTRTRSRPCSAPSFTTAVISRKPARSKCPQCSLPTWRTKPWSSTRLIKIGTQLTRSMSLMAQAVSKPSKMVPSQTISILSITSRYVIV